MAISIDGNDIEFSGQVRVINGANPDTGVAYLILTPDGGVGSLPFLAQGLPGLPPIFDSITVKEVAPASALPSPNPVVTAVSPGGSGTASHYTLKFYIHAGADGATGTNVISTATDLATTPTLGAGTDGYSLRYRNSDSKWVPTASSAGGKTYVAPSISATGSSNSSPRLLSEISIPAQPFIWRPRVFAQTIVTGTVNTRVDLIARLNDASSGDQVGFSGGLAGATPPPNVIIQAYPGGSSVPGSYGRVAAGAAATVYLRAEQQNGTSDSWATAADPYSTFCVDVQPVL